MGDEPQSRTLPLRAWAADARARELPDGHFAVPLFSRGTMSVERAPAPAADTRQPRKQDELYIVISSSSVFVCGDARAAFGPSDVLFAPVGMGHRFEEFSDEFETRIVFHGPKGREK